MEIIMGEFMEAGDVPTVTHQPKIFTNEFITGVVKKIYGKW